MNTYTVISWPNRIISTGLDLESVANLTNLRETEIEWAIDEHGRCDTETHTVLLDRV